MSTKFDAWRKQPTTIHALGVLAGTAASFAVWYATKSVEGAVGAFPFGFAAVAGSMPDNTADVKPFQQLVADEVRAVAEKHYGEMLPLLAAKAQQTILERTASGSPIPTQLMAPLGTALAPAGAGLTAGTPLGKAVEAAVALAPVAEKIEAVIATTHPGLEKPA